MRLIGPNCLGVMNPIRGPERHVCPQPSRGPATSPSSARAARCCTAILDWSLRENVGFSSFVSTGSMLDVNWGDLIDYFGSDPRTHSIVIYMESIGDASVVPVRGARSFAHQADHRDQGGTHCCGCQGRGFAHRVPDRKRRSAGRGVPAQRRAARQQHRRHFLHVRRAGQAAASAWQPAGDPHQRRRTRACWPPTRW